ALQRPDSFFVDLGLGGLRVYDGTTEGSLFPQIAKVKDSLPVANNRKSQIPSREELASDVTEDLDSEDRLFNMQLEQNPLQSDADTAVNVKLKSIEVIYNPRFLVE
ncbi:Vacuolar protein sorting-associated protein, partial [Aspergillus sclerotialis]